MNWLDILALACTTTVLFTAKTFYGRIFSSTLMIQYVAVLISGLGGGSLQPLTRVFSFVVILIGLGICLVMFFAQSNRNSDGVEK